MSVDADKPKRLFSIDALRGFDMFWIVGGEEVIREFATWGNWPYAKELDEQLEHVPWAGFHFEDLIFPLFLFLVGGVLPFSLSKYKESGGGFGRVIRRTLLLFALGLLYNHILDFKFAELRVTGVLQRIALCYGAAGLLTLISDWRGQLLTLIVILAGYWALLTYVAPPDGVAGDFSKEGNLCGWVDRHYLPGKLYAAYYGDGDNEGLLSTIPAIGTAILGVLAGHWLRSSYHAAIKVLGLALVGAGCLAGGWFWAPTFPIIKILWTSSFVLFAGGWSLLALALFYGVIDGLGWRSWAFFFGVIGSNAILIYFISHQFKFFEEASHFFFRGTMAYAGSFEPVGWALAEMTIKWLFLLWLYRNRLFLRV